MFAYGPLVVMVLKQQWERKLGICTEDKRNCLLFWLASLFCNELLNQDMCPPCPVDQMTNSASMEPCGSQVESR